MSIKTSIKNAMFKTIPLDSYLKIVYWYYHKKNLSIKQPKAFTEKLFWLKKYYQKNDRQLLQRIYDKYLVREYIEEKTGRDDLLPELYGVYSDASQIPFDLLPEEYVLKITQGSGCNLFNTPEQSLDPMSARDTLREWQQSLSDIKQIQKIYNEDSFLFNGEPRIICEEYLRDKSGHIPSDIRFFCFNGIPKLFCIDYESVKDDGTKKEEYYKNTYRMDGSFLEVDLGRKRNPLYNKPAIDKFDEMVDIAKKLSSDFIFARIDMYYANDRVICGEITPIPQGGSGVIYPEEFDLEMGGWLQL